MLCIPRPSPTCVISVHCLSTDFAYPHILSRPPYLVQCPLFLPPPLFTDILDWCSIGIPTPSSWTALVHLMPLLFCLQSSCYMYPSVKIPFCCSSIFHISTYPFPSFESFTLHGTLACFTSLSMMLQSTAKIVARHAIVTDSRNMCCWSAEDHDARQDVPPLRSSNLYEEAKMKWNESGYILRKYNTMA
jgi:hypothetical protein